jgi:hypothetical protein
MGDGMLDNAYVDLWLTAGRPVAMEPIFLEFQRRRHPAGGNLGWLYLTGGKADAALETVSAPAGGWSGMWVQYAVDRTLRPSPQETLEPWFVRDACGPAAEAPIHCLMTLGAYYAENGREEQIESLLGEIRMAAGGTGEDGETARLPLLTLAADAIDAYGWARNGNPVEREEAILKLRDLAWTALPPSVWVRWWLAVPYLEALRATGVPHVANLQLGRAYTQLGERAKARDAYVRFLQAWEEADPDLPQLEEARAALEELLAG